MLITTTNWSSPQVFGVEAKEVQRGTVKFYVLRSLIPAEKRDALVEW